MLPQPANTATPTIIPVDTATAVVAEPTTTQIVVVPTATYTATPIPLATATQPPALPTRTPTAIQTGDQAVVASLVGAQLQVAGSRWADRVTLSISSNADGSNAKPLGSARVDKNGRFTFAKGLLGPIPNPLFVVVKDKRNQTVVLVQILVAQTVIPTLYITPTITPVP